MPIYNGGGGVSGITIEEDPSALKMALNLSDLQDFPASRSSLDVYSTSETNTQISNAISAIPAYAPASFVLDYNVSTTYSPTRSAINNGTIIVVSAGTSGPATISLDVANGWQIGDRFMVVVEGGTNCVIDAGSGNYINGSGSTHTINASAIVHWVTLVWYNGSGYLWIAD
jgi:hypothetical protein